MAPGNVGAPSPAGVAATRSANLPPKKVGGNPAEVPYETKLMTPLAVQVPTANKDPSAWWCSNVPPPSAAFVAALKVPVPTRRTQSPLSAVALSGPFRNARSPTCQSNVPPTLADAKPGTAKTLATAATTSAHVIRFRTFNLLLPRCGIITLALNPSELSTLISTRHSGVVIVKDTSDAARRVGNSDDGDIRLSDRHRIDVRPRGF